MILLFIYKTSTAKLADDLKIKNEFVPVIIRKTRNKPIYNDNPGIFHEKSY